MDVRRSFLGFIPEYPLNPRHQRSIDDKHRYTFKEKEKSPLLINQARDLFQTRC
jgi:hypothetical protein